MKIISQFLSRDLSGNAVQNKFPNFQNIITYISLGLQGLLHGLSRVPLKLKTTALN